MTNVVEKSNGLRVLFLSLVSSFELEILFEEFVFNIKQLTPSILQHQQWKGYTFK